MNKLATLAIALAVTACSAPSGDTSNGGNAPSTTPGTDDGKNDPGAPPGGDPKPSDPAKPAAPIRTGSLMLSQLSFKAGATTINSYSASAFFSETTATTGGTGSTACKTSIEGDCSIAECTLATGDAGAPPGDAGAGQPAASPTAGEISVAGTTTITLAADDKGTYAPKSGQVELFAPDANVAIKAKGAAVPAFDKSIKAPSSVTVTAPAWPAAGQPLAVDRTKAISLVWTGGNSGDVTASFSSLASDKTASITCKFPANANKGTVPAAALAKLLVTTTGSVAISASSTVAFEQADWKISLVATSPAKAGASVASGVANIK